MLSLLELEARLKYTKIAAENMEIAARKREQGPGISSSDLRQRINEIEMACTIQNRCDTAIQGIGAIVELVGREVLHVDELGD